MVEVASAWEGVTAREMVRAPKLQLVVPRAA